MCDEIACTCRTDRTSAGEMRPTPWSPGLQIRLPESILAACTHSMSAVLFDDFAVVLVNVLHVAICDICTGRDTVASARLHSDELGLSRTLCTSARPQAPNAARLVLRPPGNQLGSSPADTPLGSASTTVRISQFSYLAPQATVGHRAALRLPSNTPQRSPWECSRKQPQRAPQTGEETLVDTQGLTQASPH